MSDDGKITIVTYEERSPLLILTTHNQLSDTQLIAIEETLETYTKPFIIKILDETQRSKPEILRLTTNNKLTPTQLKIITATLATQTGPFTLEIWG